MRGSLLLFGLMALLRPPEAAARERIAKPAVRSAAGADTAASHLRQARAARARSREYLDAAVAEYRAVLRRDPRSLAAQRGLARALRDQGAEEQALPYLRQVAERSADGVDSSRLGWALFRAGRWAEAADAFATARRHGQEDAETRRGAELAAAAARASGALAGEPGVTGGEPHRSPPASSPVSAAARESGWAQVWGTLWNATGFITSTVQRLLLTAIALVIAGSIALRFWGTLMGRAAPADEEGMRLARLRRLPVWDVATGRRLGRVRQALYDPAVERIAGFQVGSRWRWRVVPLEAARAVGPAGIFLADASSLVPGSEAPALGALARAGAQPLGPGGWDKRVVTEEGALVGFTRAERLRVALPTGDLTFDVSPNRFHEAWRVTLAALQLGPFDWLLGQLLDRGLELLPGHLSARVRLPVRLIHAADRHVVIVTPETAEWLDRHFESVEAQARAHLDQVKAGVAQARPLLERARDAGAARAAPMLEQLRESSARARPVLERAREIRAGLVSRSVPMTPGGGPLPEEAQPGTGEG